MQTNDFALPLGLWRSITPRCEQRFAMTFTRPSLSRAMITGSRPTRRVT
jgi:hypothetical protein